MITYVLTIRYKKLFDIDWQFTNLLIKADNVKIAIKDARTKINNVTEFIIDNIYAEH